MVTDYNRCPMLGLYQHFKGNYYYLRSVLQDTIHDGEYVCEYFNILHPEYGHFARPADQWFTDVSDRKDNVTGQIHRFERVMSIDTSMANFTTEQLLRELAHRKDSPLQSLDIEELNKCVVAVDYAVGRVCEATEDESKGVFVEAAFSCEEDARKHLLHHTHIRNAELFKRTFLPVD